MHMNHNNVELFGVFLSKTMAQGLRNFKQPRLKTFSWP